MYVYQFQFRSIEGADLSLDRYRGQPLLMVNTAAESRFADQIRRLQSVWESYRPCGLAVIGLPCDDFGHREPHENDAIPSLYLERFGADFPLTAKLSLRGRRMHPLFLALSERFGREAVPRGNFTKYLFDDRGRLVERWPSRTEPDDPNITQRIERNLHAWVI